MDCLGWGGVGWGWWHSLNLNTWWMLRNCACLVIAHMVDATQLCGGVGWGGVGMMTFFELEHMVDATQLCLSYHCTHGGCYATVRWGGVGWGGDDDILWTWTHGGCYATVLVLSLHTWWMLRNCACLIIAHMVDATQLCGGVGWGGVGMMTFFELEHMVDATQLCLSYHCTHGGCYATVRWGGVGWGGDDDILWTWTHGGCYATVLVLSLHTWWMLRNCAVGWGGVGWGWWHSLNLNTWWMLRNCACLIIAHMVDATQLCLSYHCTHGGCYATVRWGGVGWGGDDDILWTWTHGGCYATVLVLSLHTYGNCMMQSARGQQPGTLFRGFRGFDILPSYVGIVMNHYKDPHLTTKIQRKVVSLQGELPERWRIRRTSGWLGQEESAVTWNSEKSLKISCIKFFESTSWTPFMKKIQTNALFMLWCCYETPSFLIVLLHKVALANGLLGRPGGHPCGGQDLHQSRVGHHPGSTPHLLKPPIYEVQDFCPLFF